MVQARLHLILPAVLVASDLLALLDAAMSAGDVASVLLPAIDLSDRAAKDLAKAVAGLVQDRGAAFLVEDPRFAARLGADGVHLRRTDGELSDAIDSLKPERIVGVGGPLSRDEAMRAGEVGADYLMFGELADGTVSSDRAATLEQVGWWAEIFNVPCIGFAAELGDVEDLAGAGAEVIALADAVWRDPRGPAAAIQDAGTGIARAHARPAERV